MKNMTPPDTETDFDSEIIPVQTRRRSANQQDGNLLFSDMKQTATLSGKVIVKPKIEPSPLMQDILNFLMIPGPNLIIKATAGSGKTTLLEMIGDQMIRLNLLEYDRAAFLAFNKKIVQELQERLPVEFDIRTINSLGHLIIHEHCPKIPFHPKKYEHLCRETVRNRNYQPRVRADMEDRLLTAVTLTMTNIMELGTPFDHWQSTMLDFDLMVEDTDSDLYSMTFEVIRRGMALLVRPEDRSEETPSLNAEDDHHDDEDKPAVKKPRLKVSDLDWVMSYLDQVYAPAHFKWKLSDPFKYLLIDEAQDLSFGQMNLILSATDENSRIIAVGDPSQAIYNFNGSRVTSVDDLQYFIGATTMPLSVTYRCPRRHVQLAADYTDRIEAAPNAAEGELADITTDQLLSMVRSGDMLLCRTNAPLIRWCFTLARNAIRSHINGVDIGKSIVKLIREVMTWDGEKAHTDQFEDDMVIGQEAMLEKMRSVLRHQIGLIKQDAARRGKSPDLKLALAEDKMMSLKMILDEYRPATSGELVKQVRALFSEKNEGVTLSTVHKAKGLEANNVFIVEPGLLPHPKAESEQALLAEKAVQFVALTRAKRGLYFVDAESPVVPEHLSTPLAQAQT